jgi:PAS domain S-box-containing protein
MKKILNFFFVSPDNISLFASVGERRRKIINTMLGTMLGTVICLLIILFSLYFVLPEKVTREDLVTISTGCLVGLVGSALVAFLNRRISSRAAGVILLLVIYALTISADTPYEIVQGRSLIFVAVPVIMAAILYPPWGGIIVAVINSAAISYVSVSYGYGLPNLPAIWVLSFTALILWRSTSLLEHALEQVRVFNHSLLETQEHVRQINAELEQRVVERTAELQAANDQLRVSEARYRAVIEDQTELLCRFLPDTTLTFVNDAYCRYFGKTQEALIGASFLQLIPKEGWDSIKHHINSMMENPAQIQYEHQVLGPNGEIFWQQWADRAICDSEGRIIEFQSVGRDITERKRIEDELRESNERYRSLIELSPDPIVIIQDGQYKMVSSAFHEIFGYTQQDVADGLSIYKLVREQDVKAVRDRDTERIAGRSPSNIFAIDLVSKDGKIIPCESSTTEIQYNGRRAYMTIVRDITQRRDAETALRESEALYRQMFNNHTAMMHLVDPETGSIVEANPAASGFYGYSLETLQQMTIRDLNVMPPEEVTGLLHEARTRRQTFFTVPHQLASGEIRQVEIYTVPIQVKGRPLLYSILHDVTERKRAEDALQKMNQQLEIRVEQRTAEMRVSKERLQNFVNQSFEAISRTELDHPVDITLPVETQIDLIYENAYMAECNQAMADMYNIPSPEQFIGMRLIDAHGGKDNPINRAVFKNFIENGYKSTNDETFEYAADGRPVWFLSNTVGTVNDGYLVRLWGTALDITERKLAEQALRESEVKYSVLFHKAAIPAALVQLPESIIVDVNEAIEQTFGYDRSEIIGKNSVEAGLFQSDERERIYAAFQQGILTEGSEARFLKKSGEGLIALVKANAVEFGGRKHAMITIQDITARKRAEQELIRAHEQLQELSRQLLETQENERRSIARELHDEIGQTLTGLKILLEMALRPPVEKNCEKIKQAQKAAGDLIEQVSRLSLNLRPTMLDDFGLLPTLLWLTDSFTAQTEIQIDFTHEGIHNKRFDPATESAAYRLVQASLTNVARHAGVKQVKAQILASDERLHLMIEDAGRGFDLEAVRARGEASGLTGMRERVNLLKGDFNIDTAPGHGTRINIHLPLKRMEEYKDEN